MTRFAPWAVDLTTEASRIRTYSARPMSARTAAEIRSVNLRYHDAAAAGYDAKWGISYDERGRAQVLGKLAKALGGPLPRVQRSLEIGAGTGYFTLHLALAGLVARPVASDISPGMLAALERSAAELDVSVTTARCEAAELPFADGSFDLVLGHAVLHHLPELDAAFAEFARVLRPGGRLVFCGEPSRGGHRLAEIPKRAGLLAAPIWRRALGAPPRGVNGHSDHGLEPLVDVHSFGPAELEARAARAGLHEVRVSGDELASSWFGWLNRTLEASADPDSIPTGWYRFAQRGYLTLRRTDERLLEPWLPAGAFYNLLLSARSPSAER